MKYFRNAAYVYMYITINNSKLTHCRHVVGTPIFYVPCSLQPSSFPRLSVFILFYNMYLYLRFSSTPARVLRLMGKIIIFQKQRLRNTKSNESIFDIRTLLLSLRSIPRLETSPKCTTTLFNFVEGELLTNWYVDTFDQGNLIEKICMHSSHLMSSF